MSKEKAKEKIKIKHNAKTNGINGSPWSTFFLVAPYITLFAIFIALPVFISALLSLTYFNAIDTPSFVGFKNYVNMFSVDRDFMQYVVPQTLTSSIIASRISSNTKI